MSAKPRSMLQLARAQGKVGRVDSAIEAEFAQQLKAEHVPAWIRNFRFLEAIGRKHELDFCWPRLWFAVEVEGEVHRIKERFHEDIKKHWYAMRAGWTVLRVDGRAIRSGDAIQWTRALIWERT